jgi:hypothetical protein
VALSAAVKRCISKDGENLVNPCNPSTMKLKTTQSPYSRHISLSSFIYLHLAQIFKKDDGKKRSERYHCAHRSSRRHWVRLHNPIPQNCTSIRILLHLHVPPLFPRFSLIFPHKERSENPSLRARAPRPIPPILNPRLRFLSQRPHFIRLTS